MESKSDENKKTNLRNSLKTKILEKNMKRCSTVRKDGLLEKDFKKFGIDKEKFKADLEALKKQGGFSPEQLQTILSSMNQK
jgi:hypothetical protein